jgi:uracil-DNA glycosylase family 4
MSELGTRSTLPERQAALVALQARMRACQRCVLAGHIPSAVPIFSGRASDEVMVIGQAPGALSDDRGVPFAGPSGRDLDRWFRDAGFPEGYFRNQTYLTSLTRCFPGKSPQGEGDRPPSRAERLLCADFLREELELVRPKVILLVGKMAIEAFLGKARLEEVVGTAVERDGALLIPLPHASGVSRWLNAPEHKALLAQAIRHLSDARAGLDSSAGPRLADKEGGM